jgi:hypothetical protein
MSPYAIIPSGETESFWKLTTAQREDVALWSLIVQEIDASESKHSCMKAIAVRYADNKRLSFGNIKTKYYAFKKTGWKALLNKSTLKAGQKVRVLGDASKGQPPQFIEFWKYLQESYQRSSGAAYRELLRRYRSGEQIPGIGNWRNVWMESVGTMPPEKCPMDPPLPPGWSQRNLNRPEYRSTKAELAFARGGLADARKYLPRLFTTRVGMQAGQIYVFDDMWHDHLVNAPGNAKGMKPLEFACQDVYSAARIAWGVQPMRENPDTGKREMLRETEMRFLLAHVLCCIGYHPQGCRLHVEHGTAAIRKDLEEMLFNQTAGAITVHRGGIHNKPGHDGAYAPQPRGNSRFKSTLESQHNLVHNELAALPGQVGKDRDHSPEGLYGLERYNTKLLTAASELLPERAALLKLPVLSFDQFKEILNETYTRINSRTDHKLEGFEEAGLVITEYRLSEGSPWFPANRMLEMAEDERNAVSVLVQKSIERCCRTRLLSPAEVWALGQKNLVRLPRSYVPIICGPQNAKMIRLGDDHLFSFEDRRMGPGIHRYVSEVETEDGLMQQLQPNRFYMVHATPFDTGGIFISTEDGFFLGAARRLNTPCKMNSDDIHRRMGKTMAAENRLLSNFKDRHAGKASEKLEMHTHNAAVLRGAPITPDELFRAERIAEAVPNEEDLEAVTRFDRRTPASEDFSNEEISDLFCNN